jgi:hypothetical protein
VVSKDVPHLLARPADVALGFQGMVVLLGLPVLEGGVGGDEVACGSEFQSKVEKKRKRKRKKRKRKKKKKKKKKKR